MISKRPAIKDKLLDLQDYFAYSLITDLRVSAMNMEEIHE